VVKITDCDARKKQTLLLANYMVVGKVSFPSFVKWRIITVFI
jgi:hypothetical protein